MTSRSTRTSASRGKSCFSVVSTRSVPSPTGAQLVAALRAGEGQRVLGAAVMADELRARQVHGEARVAGLHGATQPQPLQNIVGA